MTYKPQDNSMMYGGYLSTSQSLPYDANVTWKSVDQQFDFDSAVKSCQSVNGAIIPDYPKSCVFADVCMTYQNGYYAYVYGFSGGFRKNNALLGRNQQQRKQHGNLKQNQLGLRPEKQHQDERHLLGEVDIAVDDLFSMPNPVSPNRRQCELGSLLMKLILDGS